MCVVHISKELINSSKLDNRSALEGSVVSHTQVTELAFVNVTQLLSQSYQYILDRESSRMKFNRSTLDDLNRGTKKRTNIIILGMLAYSQEHHIAY